MLSNIVQDTIIPIFLTLLIFGVLVLVHELGHYLAAKKFGVYVEEFAIGLGPKLWAIEKNETLFTIRAIPLGGYCKMLGEDKKVDEKDDRAFNNKKVHERIIIILAGIFMNMLLAIVIQIFLTTFSTVPTLEIGKLEPGFPAEEAGMEVGDQIISVNGKKVKIFDEISYSLYLLEQPDIDIEFKKPSGEIIEKTIKPNIVEIEGYEYKRIGISPLIKRGSFVTLTIKDQETKQKVLNTLQKANIFEQISYSLDTVLLDLKFMAYSLKMLVTGQFSLDDLSGPIGIVEIVGDTYSENVTKGFWETLEPLLAFGVILSINLAIMNFLPLPALDGGRFLFLLLEALRGKPIDQDKEGIIHLIGFLFLLCLAVVVAYSDIIKIIQN